MVKVVHGKGLAERCIRRKRKFSLKGFLDSEGRTWKSFSRLYKGEKMEDSTKENWKVVQRKWLSWKVY